MAEPLKIDWSRNDYSRIPFALYHDPEILKHEEERIFRGPVWSVLGFEGEIPNPGDFRVRYIGSTPIVVNRDAKGVIYAFVNRCSHRGAEIVREPFGNSSSHLCIYHCWSYNHQGDLTGVPFRKGVNGGGGMPADFDPKQHPLTKLHVALWKGVIFASFHTDPAPIEEYLGPLMTDHVGELLSKPIRILGYQRQTVDANWKLYHENIRDAYHGSLLHEFNRTFGLSRLTQKAGSYMDAAHKHSILFQYSGSDSDEDAHKAYAENQVQRKEYMKLNDYEMVKLVKENPRGISTRIISVFPNAFFHQIFNSLAMRLIRPLGTGRFELTWILFGYQDDSETMVAHRLNQANMVGPAGLISMEDGEALELVQRSTAPDQSISGVVEMGGVGPIVDRDTRANETTIRGFWAYYSQLMQIEPAGAFR